MEENNIPIEKIIDNKYNTDFTKNLVNKNTNKYDNNKCKLLENMYNLVNINKKKQMKNKYIFEVKNNKKDFKNTKMTKLINDYNFYMDNNNCK